MPLFCAKFIRLDPAHAHSNTQEHASHADPKKKRSLFAAVVGGFNALFLRLQAVYNRAIVRCLAHPIIVASAFGIFVVLSFMLYPALGKAFFPRTDPGQFVVNVKVPAGTRIEVTNDYIARIEQDIRSVVSAEDLNMIVSNIGITPDLSAIYTSNSGMHTAFIQVSLKEDHKIGS